MDQLCGKEHRLKELRGKPIGIVMNGVGHQSWRVESRMASRFLVQLLG
jgi:hypothetical protein